LVEAAPHKFVECVRNRPRSIVEHCALVPPDFEGKCVEIRYSNLMSYAPALARIDGQKQIMDGSEYLSGPEKKLSSQAFLAPARTMQEVISKHNIQQIDFMVLDMEGAEIEALRGMNFHLCRVENILIEVRDVRDLRTTDEFLSTLGFKRYAQLTYQDYLYRVGTGF
jgi:FkbM family methyltransferase